MQNLEDWINALKQSRKLILVEGKKDKRALKKLGIKNILTLKKPLYKVIEEVAEKNKECVLLFDLDSEGKKLYSKLKHQLQKHKVKVDRKFREFLFKHTKLTQIEGLSKHIENLKCRLI